MVLNYVRCPFCGGNLAVLNHPCDEDARERATSEAVARMFAAVQVDPADATADQLRSKLAECEEALRTTEQALAVAEDAVTTLGNDVLRFAPQAFDDDVSQEEIVVRYVRWLERMALNSRADIVFTADPHDDELLAELAATLDAVEDGGSGGVW